MSLRDRARARRAEASERRQHWSPAIDSGPYKVYNWWRRTTHNYQGRENFCHFWRVVLIWVPLLAARKALAWLFTRLVTWTMIGMVAFGGLVYLISAFTSVMASVGLGVLLFVYVAFFGRMVAHLFSYIGDLTDDLRWRSVADRPVLNIALMVLGAPAFVAVGLMLALLGIGLGIGWLFTRWPMVRLGRWIAFGHPQRLSWFRPWLVMILMAVGVLLAIPVTRIPTIEVLIWMACVVATTFALMGTAVGLGALADRRRRRRRARIVARQNSYDMAIDDFTQDEFESHPYNQGSLVAGQGSKFRRGLTFVGDFLVLAWSVVVTSKWRICPTVDLPE